MPHSQPIASGASFICVVALLGLAGCSNEPPPPMDVRPVAAPDASRSNAAGTPSESVAGTRAPVPIVDSGAPDTRADVEAGPEVDASPPTSEDDDAGSWVPPDLECMDDQWQLAPGFLLAQPADYVADRSTQFLESTGGLLAPRTLSEAGERCATAKDRAACENAFTLIPNLGGRHLITTHRDTVKVWDSTRVRTLFGLIDTPAEALWVLEGQLMFIARCDVVVTPLETGDGFTVENLLNIGICGTVPPPDIEPKYRISLVVKATAEVHPLKPTESWPDPACAMQP